MELTLDDSSLSASSVTLYVCSCIIDCLGMVSSSSSLTWPLIIKSEVNLFLSFSLFSVFYESLLIKDEMYDPADGDLVAINLDLSSSPSSTDPSPLFNLFFPEVFRSRPPSA